MSRPIYQLMIAKSNIAGNLALKNLPETERVKLFEKEAASRKAAGETTVLFCNSAWADEERPMWGVSRFPSLEARIQHTRDLQEMGWLNYFDAFTLLGTSEQEPETVTMPHPIYMLWILRSNPAGSQHFAGIAKDLVTAVWEKHDAVYKENNSLTMLSCDSYWCNQAYPYFGISVFPNIEACMRICEALKDLGWPEFIESTSLLGISE
jgi:hypothetical protein